MKPPPTLWVLDEAATAEREQDIYARAEDAAVLAQPCVRAAIRAAYTTDRAKVLLPWARDSEKGGLGWESVRHRLDVNGHERAYVGRQDGLPVFGVYGEGQVPGGEAEADAWLRDHGYVLLDEEGS